MRTRTRPSDSEAWTADFAALRDATREELPPVEATERFALASALDPTTRERKPVMSFIRRKPLLAALIMLAALVVLVPVSYAVVDRLFLSFDPDDTPEQIADDLRSQLESAGIDDAEVEVERSGAATRVKVRASVDEHAEVDVQPRHGPAGDSSSLRIGISIEGDGTGIDHEELAMVAADEGFTTLALDGSAEELEAWLAERGYDASVTVGEGRVDVAILGLLD